MKGAAPDPSLGSPDDGPVAAVKEPLAEGTLTSAQSEAILRDHSCKANVRDRQRGEGRQLFVVGRSSNIKAAYQAARAAIAENGTTGGRSPQAQPAPPAEASAPPAEPIAPLGAVGAAEQRQPPGLVWRAQHVALPLHDSWGPEVGYWQDVEQGAWWPLGERGT
ncbi:unnamed protein product, partial [Prorocentrum cordatum]